jgi:hypothetical protein
VFTAPHLLLHYNGTIDFASAVRQTILLGGENANRGTFIASILAAAAGSQSGAVPRDWLTRTTEAEAVTRLAEQLATAATSTGIRSFESAESDKTSSHGRTHPLALSPLTSNHVQTGPSVTPRQSTTLGREASAARVVGKREVRLGNSPGCIANSNHTTSNATRPPSHPDDIAGLRAL